MKPRLECDPHMKRFGRGIARLSERELRQLVIEVCRLGLSSAGLARDRTVARAMKAVEACEGLPARDGSRVRRLAEKADEVYLEALNRKGYSSKAVPRLFLEARVLAGLVAALDPNSRYAATEAVYEIGLGMERSAELMQLLERATAANQR